MFPTLRHIYGIGNVVRKQFQLLFVLTIYPTSLKCTNFVDNVTKNNVRICLQTYFVSYILRNGGNYACKNIIGIVF